MMFLTGGFVAIYIARLALVGLLVAFGIWAYRRVNLRSLPWLMAYLLLGVPVAFLAPLIANQIIHLPGATIMGLAKDTFMMQWNIWGLLISVLTHCILAVLALSDVLFLMARAGVEIDQKPLQALLRSRERSTALGMTLIGLLLFYPASSLVVWIAAQ